MTIIDVVLTYVPGIGLSLFIAELTGVYFTGGSLNPARSFGPAVVNRNFHHYHWIYWVGPILGSLVAAGFYKFIKILEYETANPGQDSTHAAQVDKRRNLLIAAGINESDANHVAHELTDNAVAANNGGPNGNVMAHGQGRKGDVEDQAGMYGTRFRGSKVSLSGTTDGTTNGTSSGAVPNGLSQTQRPGFATTGSQQGRYSYLGSRGQSVSAPVGQRMESPAMATQEELYAPLASHQDEPLGALVRNEKGALY